HRRAVDSVPQGSSIHVVVHETDWSPSVRQAITCRGVVKEAKTRLIGPAHLVRSLHVVARIGTRAGCPFAHPRRGLRAVLAARRGVRGVGIDAIIERSGVARMTLYRHFRSKDELVLAFLERRDERWTREWLQAGIEQRASAPADRLLAIFDVFDEWFRRDDYE